MQISSAAQKPESWVAQQTTHSESLGGPYLFWVVRDIYWTSSDKYAKKKSTYLMGRNLTYRGKCFAATLHQNITRCMKTS